ncbi:hypothetical protein A8F94_06950 [Bacillus sp. FJAT-27225]|uniref:hypothetical protein n=1 Tax=Bacillus sp. FJAT-27225 TaxID=1743144 RepID=UPI00080C20C1|nr:hypothetical protein [Bacillus sp. FJAT-27225]OCA87590.1 hypothetical protein A8F94_06950 [Bacillus sp. FJAT-27225]
MYQHQPINYYHRGGDQRIFAAPLVGGFLGGLLGSAIAPRPFYGGGFGFGGGFAPYGGYGAFSPYGFNQPFGYGYGFGNPYFI